MSYDLVLPLLLELQFLYPAEQLELTRKCPAVPDCNEAILAFDLEFSISEIRIKY
jgi:hypothetical protein